MLRRTLPFLLVLAPTIAFAQTPTTISSGAPIQIPVPANAQKPRLQVLLAGTNTVLDEERANVQNGVAVAKLEADPGLYDVRLVSNDKARTPLGLVSRFQIPGFKREAGRWLFNGSPVNYASAYPGAMTSPLLNLRRDKKVKLPFVIPMTQPLGLPELLANGLVVNATSATGSSTNPDAARFLFVGSNDDGAAIERVASSADAIVIDGNNQSLLKIARRNAEEAPNFDLPIFVQFQTAPSPIDELQAFQAGASNIIVPGGTSNPVLDVLTRQSARFSGAVTLEDVGMQAKDFDRFAPILRRAGRVPLLARLPGDGNGEKKADDKGAESLFVSFDSSTDATTLGKIERAAKVGATIYCEGVLPTSLFSRWGEITKTQVAPLAASKKSTLTLSEPWFWGTINEQNFDVAQSLTINVKPSIAAQTKDVRGVAVETVARPIARFNDDPNGIMLCPVGKGRVIWAPFDVSGTALSRLLELAVLGNVSGGLGTTTPAKPSTPVSPDLRTAYYAAIAGAMQPALVNFSATSGDAAGVTVALRAIPAVADNPKSSLISLVAFFNESNAPVDLDARVRGNGGYALDLMTDQTVPLKVRDFGTRMSLSIPANGFRWIAIAKDAQGWNDAGKDKVKARLR